jgi:dinuclear metal center YbgI/SA1388 family protein
MLYVNPSMPLVKDILKVLNQIAPQELALPEDRIGLQCGSENQFVESIVVSLDPSIGALNFCLSKNARALVSHHALIYRPLQTLTWETASALKCAIERNISVMVSHTNWDAAPGGINDTLAKKLGLTNTNTFGPSGNDPQLKLVTFLPKDALESLVDALSEAGAGQIGLYRRCAFYHSGTGTYEPQASSNPMIGNVGNREFVEEFRLEMVLPANKREAITNALLQAHPYDEPAFDFYMLARSPGIGIGRLGKLPVSMDPREFQNHISEALSTPVRSFGISDRIQNVAVVGGAGGDMWQAAQVAGADALVTGEVRHHEGLAAAENGFCIYEAGHYSTEQPGIITLAESLKEHLPEVEVFHFEPKPGEYGRPS